MNTWITEKKLNETLLKKDEFYSHLNMGDTPNADYVY